MISSNDSAYVEFFTSEHFKQFIDIYKEYSSKIDSMKINVNYAELYGPEVFYEALKIREYLQKSANATNSEEKK